MAITRRKFILKAAAATLAGASAGYALWEAHDLLTRPRDLLIPGLPAGFSGIRAAFVADLHHGPYASLEYLGGMVRRIHEAAPELVLLGGDYTYYKARYIPPVMEILSALRAPLGVYAVRGNHDNRAGKSLSSLELRRNGIREITNTGLWLERGGDRLYLAGVDDLWTGRPDLRQALAPVS
ncbi:MAG TPA: metallophosphoesterase, partial [Chthoniobacterales bacterium]